MQPKRWLEFIARSSSAAKYRSANSSTPCGTPATWQANLSSASKGNVANPRDALSERLLKRLCAVGVGRHDAHAGHHHTTALAHRFTPIPEIVAAQTSGAVRAGHGGLRAKFVSAPEHLPGRDGHFGIRRHDAGELDLGVDEKGDRPLELLPGVVEGEEVDAQGHDAHLSHGLQEDDARCHRVAGEVPAVEVGLRSKAIGRDDVLFVELEDAVHEAEGLLLGEHLQDLIRSQWPRPPRRDRHSPILPPREFFERSG